MFNLVSKRYIFLGISLLIIIPGVISLFWKGLFLGIDFTAGSSLQFRPSQAVANTADINKILAQVGLKDVQINVGTNANLPGNQVVWVRLNTQVDSNVKTAIQTALQTKYGSQLSVLPSDLSLTGSDGKTKTTTVEVLTNFTPSGAKTTVVPLPKDIQAVLTTLFKTTKTTDLSNPTGSQPTISPALTPTVTATSVASPTPQPSPTAKATASPTASQTPTTTPTATPAANQGTIQVNVADIKQGSVTDTINILTTTSSNGGAITDQIQAAFLNQHGIYLYMLDNSSAEASVAGDTIRNSILAVIAASALILGYVWFAFRKVQKPWRYGACAIIALLHDVLVVLGIFSILGWTLHIQVDALFITALLTVVGFSVHDTIVVFDRIRENMQRRTSETFDQVVNASLIQTMARSLNTSLTVLFTLSALTLFGGESIRVFTFTLLIGIFSGTYSSIFNASMLLVIWERGELGLWRFNRDARLPDGRRNRAEHELVRSRG